MSFNIWNIILAASLKSWQCFSSYFLNTGAYLYNQLYIEIYNDFQNGNY